MEIEIIDLYKQFNLKRTNENAKGYLTCVSHTELTEVLPVKCIRPAMLIVPGGGYTFVSQREDEPVALKFLDDGYNTFTLDYSVNTTYPTQILEIFMAMAYIKRNAEKYSHSLKIIIGSLSAEINPPPEAPHSSTNTSLSPNPYLLYISVSVCNL